jgi:uncharacterized membrane protein YdbT with pleckstrin-like domain
MPTTVDHDGYLRKVLGQEEQVLFIVRQHTVFLFGRMFWWLLLGLVILGSVTFVQFSELGHEHPRLLTLYALLLVPLVPIWWLYLVWDNHKCVVTNRRVLQMSGVLGKEVVDAMLDQVNDVKTEQSLFGRMFNYGDVEVVTASEILSDNMKRIARPLEFKRALVDAKEALMHPRPAA